jgi:hypothetical protein
MLMPKPTDADKVRFRALVPEDPRVEIRPMFGQLAAFVNGNMFFGLYGSTLGVKVAPDQRALIREAGGGPFGPAERPMNGYAALPNNDREKWISAALDYVAGLPPKPSKK